MADEDDDVTDVDMGDGTGDGDDEHDEAGEEEAEKPADKPADKPDKPKPKAPVPGQRKVGEESSPDLRDEALRKANREAHERRLELKKVNAELADLKLAQASEAEKAVLAARREGAEEAEKALRPAVVRATARAALSAAGCIDSAVQKTLMRLVDTSKVELEDGEVVSGLDDQIDELRAQFPEKFQAAVSDESDED